MGSAGPENSDDENAGTVGAKEPDEHGEEGRKDGSRWRGRWSLLQLLCLL